MRLREMQDLKVGVQETQQQLFSEYQQLCHHSYWLQGSTSENGSLDPLLQATPAWGANDKNCIKF